MNVGFVGLGLMGAAMATRLLKAGETLTIHNRTEEKGKTLLALGARWAKHPGAVAAESDVVFSMLSTSEAVRLAALGPQGILAGFKKGGVHVDCSTISPAVSKELAEAYDARGCFFIHCPVLGSVPQATEGSLLLFCGGDGQATTRIEPLLKVLGSKIWKFKHPEQASHTKLLCNLFIAGMMTTLAQALVFAEKASVSPAILLDIIGNSALNAPTYQTKGKSMIEKNFAPRFFVEHMLKDINLMLEAAKAKGVDLPTVEVARRMFSQAVERGYGKEDYSAVIKVVG